MKRRSQAGLRELAAVIHDMSPRGRRRTRFPAHIWAEVKRLADSGVGVEDLCGATGLKPLTVARQLAKMRGKEVKTLVIAAEEPRGREIGSAAITLPNGVRLELSPEALSADLLSRLMAC